MIFNKERTLSSSQRSGFASWRKQDGRIDDFAHSFIQNAPYVTSCARVGHRKIKNTIPLTLQHHHPDDKLSVHHRLYPTETTSHINTHFPGILNARAFISPLKHKQLFPETSTARASHIT